jgi:23S rRNA (uracil1939-C5)-methyltransferase
MSANATARFELVADKLVYGGSALGHHAGRPVLVPYALPGERVQAETVRVAKGMVHARLLELIGPAPERIAAPCPYFGRCGGCHYQHLDGTRQLDVKRDILRETLRRVGHIDWPGEIVAHTADPWAYRNQVRLKIGPDGQIGFFAADSHDLIAVDACPISSPHLNTLIRDLARSEWAAKLRGWDEVELRTDDRDENVVLTFRGSVPDSEERCLESLAQDCLRSLPGVTGIAFDTASGATVRGRLHARVPRRLKPEIRIFGNASLRYRVGEFDYRVSPGAFFQASRFLLPEFTAAVTSNLTGPPGLAIDLYAGVGLFTLPLTRRFREVVGVEAGEAAALDLAVNLRSQRASSARAVHATAADFLRRYAQAAPDLVVLDPPRAGAEAEALRRLAALAPAQLRYVSCHPPTLARDLAVLLRYGYGIERLDLFDLFPQTFHIESVAWLRRI